MGKIYKELRNSTREIECRRCCGRIFLSKGIGRHERLCLLPRTLERLREIAETSESSEKECWFWGDRIDGRCACEGRDARRIAWEILHETNWPDGKIVCHHCDVGGCWNPRHFYPGTQLTNMQDAADRGRLYYQTPEAAARASEAVKRKWASMTAEERAEREARRLSGYYTALERKRRR